MKYLLILLLITFGANAKKQTPEYCAELEELSRIIMEKRQREVSMSKLMIAAGENELTKLIVIAAYKTRKYGSEEFKTDAVNSFANGVYYECITAK